MRTFRRLCVVCGSSAGRQPAYADAARDLGRTLAKRGIGVVYGGARAGLMGVVADAACAAGGEVTGVITPDLAARVGHDGVYVEVVETLHQRKQRFADLADGYIALPGGFGTLEELFEAATWNQLGIQDKPTGLLNVGGYFDGLLSFLGHVEREGFVRHEHAASLHVADEAASLLAAMAAHRQPRVGKWRGG